MGFRYGRAGGAQLGAPARGWIWGLSEYQGRFESTYSSFLTTRQYGGDFILLPHDLWGTNQSNSSIIWPGDDGEWDDYDQFMDIVLQDLKSHNMLEHMVWDTRNELDGGYLCSALGSNTSNCGIALSREFSECVPCIAFRASLFG